MARKRLPADRARMLVRIADELRIAAGKGKAWEGWQGFVTPTMMRLSAEVLDLTAARGDASKLFNWRADSGERDKTGRAIIAQFNNPECRSLTDAIERVSQMRTNGASRSARDTREIRRHWKEYCAEFYPAGDPPIPACRRAVK